MVQHFINLVGDVSGYNPDVVLVLAFFMFVVVVLEFFRFFEILVDKITSRKR